MKRTREEYDKVIAYLSLFTPDAFGHNLEAMHELIDSAVALEAALNSLKARAEAMRDAGLRDVPTEDLVLELELILSEAVLVHCPIGAAMVHTVGEGAPVPSPATPSQLHQSEKIMGNPSQEKVTGPSGNSSVAGNSSRGV